MILLQIPDELLTTTFQNDWAIILAILILAILQGYKIWADTRTAKSRGSFESEQKETMADIRLYLKILSDKYTEEVTDLQMPIIINEFVGHVEKATLCEAAASITRNHMRINMKEEATKLEVFIHNQFNELITNLGRFKWKGRYLGEFVNIDRKNKVVENVLEIVCRERDTNEQKMIAYRNLGSAIENRFTEIRNEIKSKAYE